MKYTLISIVFLCFGYVFATAPVSNFNVAPADPIMDGTCVTFTDASTNTPDTWQWTIDGVQFSTAQNPPCQTLTTGVYNVCLYVSNADGNNTSCQDVEVVDPVPPIAGFTWDGSLATEGNCLPFTNTSQNFENAWSWTVDGVEFSTTETPACQSWAAGSYNVCLTVSNPWGSDVICQTVTIGAENVFGTDVLVTGCTGTIVDDGGTAGNYSDNSTQTMTLCSGDGSLVQVYFPMTDLSLQLSGGDVINVYDGTDVSGCFITQITSGDNSAEPGFLGIGGADYTLTSLSSCMTLEFVTDALTNNIGFEGEISCVTGPSNPVNSDGTTQTGCGISYQDDGGACGNYAASTTGTTTFCTGTSDVFNWVLDSLNLGSGDQIQVYEGTNTSGDLLLTLTSANNSTTGFNQIFNSSCVTVVFTSDGSNEGQGWTSSFNCRDTIYELDVVDGSTFYTCSGDLYDSGLTGNYGNNENYTVTYCAEDASQVIRLASTNFTLSPGDTLYVYDGTSTAGQLIYTADESDNYSGGLFGGYSLGEHFQISGLNQCITLQFISNGSGTSSGFVFDITCQTPPPVCGGGVVAGDNMEGAPLVCDFSTYCGNTSSFYGVDMVSIDQNSSLFTGSLENNSWVTFVADATTASFDFSVPSGCGGVQLAVYDISDEGNIVLKSDSTLQTTTNSGGSTNFTIGDGFTGSGPVYAAGLIPGQTYYIMFDGSGGAECDYTLTAGIGFQLPDITASGDVVMCENDPETITVSDANGNNNITYTWTDNLGSQSGGTSVDLSTLPPGNYVYEVQAVGFENCTVDEVRDTVLVTVTDCTPLSNEIIQLSGATRTGFNDLHMLTNLYNPSSTYKLQFSVNGNVWEDLSVLDVQELEHLTAISDFQHMIENADAFYRVVELKEYTFNTSNVVLLSNWDDLLIKLFPNPVKDELQVVMTNDELKDKSYNIIDLRGRLIASGELSTASTVIDTRDWENGFYYFQYTANDGQIQRELIVKE